MLIERYPREAWTGHANLGEAGTVLARPARRVPRARQDAHDRNGRLPRGEADAEEFRRFFAPRLQFFLQGLEGHHQIEEFQFFPIFRRAEPRLVKGFDVLEGDHEAIHAEMLRVVDSANEMLRTLDGDSDARRVATDAYADTTRRLLKSLVRHLDDEEDLIVPVILDQGERKLFWG